MTIDDLVAEILRYHYDLSCEKRLQDGLEVALRDRAELAIEREFILSSKDRIDFFHPDSGVGIEVKTDGGLAQVGLQLIRYAKHSNIRGLILVSTKAAHMALPEDIGGKPFRRVHLRWL